MRLQTALELAECCTTQWSALSKPILYNLIQANHFFLQLTVAGVY